MGVKKFIGLVTETLGLDAIKKASKKKSIKNLLKKLRNKKGKINKRLKVKIDKKKREDLKEEKEIILLQIKKGEGILKKLNSVDVKNDNNAIKEKNGK